MTILQIIAAVLAVAGLIFMTISFIGLIRLPDFFCRLHAQSVGDSLGALLIIVAMMLGAGSGLMSIKVAMVGLVIALTGPVGTNLMMIAAMNNKEYREYKKKNPDGTPKEGN